MASRTRRHLSTLLGGVLAAGLGATVLLAPTATPAATAATVPAAARSLPAPSVRVTGGTALGQTLTATVTPPGIAGVRITYTWLRDSLGSRGNHGAKHQLVLSDTGHTVRVRVAFSKSGYRSSSVTRSVVRLPAVHVKGLSAAKAKVAGLRKDASVRYAVVGKTRWVQYWTGTRMVMYSVRGKQNTAYTKSGGHKGPGVPTGNAQCRLDGRVCLQHYTHGTIYAGGTEGWRFTKVKGVRGELIATAMSQVGYRAKLGYYALHNTKYNEWVGAGGAWCSFFQAWAAARSGNAKLLPTHTSFAKFRKWLQRTGTRLSGPKVGSYVLLSVTGTYSHVGLISHVAKGGRSFTIIEGNWGEAVGTRTLTTGGTNAPQQFWDLKGI